MEISQIVQLQACKRASPCRQVDQPSTPAKSKTVKVVKTQALSVSTKPHKLLMRKVIPKHGNKVKRMH